MDVCEICSAFLVVGDTQKRMDSHLEGKQHTGYDQIRKAYEEVKVSCPFPLSFLSLPSSSLGKYPPSPAPLKSGTQ